MTGPRTPAGRVPAAGVLGIHARLRDALRVPRPDAIRYMNAHVRASVKHADTDRPATAGSLFAAGRDGPALCREFAKNLLTSVTYQVTAEMTGIIHSAYTEGRGDVTGLHAEELPAEQGFAWLDDPVHLTARRAPPGDPRPPVSVTAVSWAVCAWTVPGGGDAVPGVQVTGWADPRTPGPWMPAGKHARRQVRPVLPLIPVLTDVTPLGRAPADFQRDGTLGLSHWVHILWIWMSAEITAIRRDPVTRAYRHRASPGRTPAEVNVVTLRRARTAGDPPGEARDIQWTCCWPVQGHHRHTRLVPGAAPHHATPAPADRGACVICGGPVTWVKGYIKGPEGKPLRVHDTTLYRLSR